MSVLSVCFPGHAVERLASAKSAFFFKDSLIDFLFAGVCVYMCVYVYEFMHTICMQVPEEACRGCWIS